MSSVADSPIMHPFGESEDEIRNLLAGVSVPLLVVSLVHLTGSMEVLRHAARPKPPRFPADLTGSLEPGECERIRELALPTVVAFRDGRLKSSFELSDAHITEMTEYLLGAPLKPEYLPLFRDELGLSEESDTQPIARAALPAPQSDLPVLVIGAGMSGLLMAFRLREGGIPFTVVEKNSSVGGTWLENRYPGCRVDVPSHAYSYAMTREYAWPNLYSPQAELRKYFEACANRFEIRSSIQFRTEVVSATYDAQDCCWTATIRHDNVETTLKARAIVSAVGQLNRPAIPKIEGADSFEGEQFHTARWPREVELAGKRIAVVGSAATAVQLIPELAETASELFVYQRTPNWIIIHPEYRREMTPGELWAQAHLPFFARWRRVFLFNPARDGAADHLKIDPEWPQDGLSISKSNHALRLSLTAGIKKALEHAPHLHDKVIPEYPPYTKRPNIGDGGFYRALVKPHVHLVTNGISRITRNAIVDASGTTHEVDAIVYATGFQSLAFLSPMKITGLGGVDLHTMWGNEPRAYLGMTIPKFPNFFCMYGPGTNLGYNGNLIFNSECQSRYIMGCLNLLASKNATAMDVREDIYKDYALRLEVALQEFSWAHPSTGNWYRNADGKVISNSPWRLIDYWMWTRKPECADYELYARR